MPCKQASNLSSSFTSRHAPLVNCAWMAALARARNASVSSGLRASMDMTIAATNGIFIGCSSTLEVDERMVPWNTAPVDVQLQ